jgi:hypothetical protein
MQLRSLPLKYSLKSHIPNTILNRSHRHNGNKDNIALGSKRSLLKEGKLVASPRLTQPITITPSLTSRPLALRHLTNHISRLQALHHHLPRTSPLRPLPHRFRRTIRPKALFRSHMPGHTLRARPLSRSLDHTLPAQALALLFRPPINMSLLFLLLNNMQLLQSPLPNRIPRLRTLFHQLNHMSHIWVLFYLRPLNLRRLPHLGNRISRHRAPYSLHQRPLRQCLHTARPMQPRPRLLSPYRPYLYCRPQATLSLSLPPPSLLPASRIYQIPTCLDATKLPSLYHRALLARNTPMRSRSRSRRPPPRPRREAPPGGVKAGRRMKTSELRVSGSVGKRRARARVVSRRRRTKSWRGRSIWSLTWRARRRVNLTAARTRNCRVSPRGL